jgi:hypothetical protein
MEPKAAQHTVETKLKKARKKAKQTKTGLLVYQGRIKDAIVVKAKIKSFGLINCKTNPVMKLPLEFFISCFFGGRKLFMARYSIYAAPSFFIGS